MAENKKLYINTDEKHEPTDVIYSNLYASDELKAATLRKMKEIKRENERRQALRSKIVKRAMLTAAIIALVIAVTPLRGYVASAAESAYEAFHSWMEDVFRVGMKKTDNGCMVEIIEARVANDFLYITVEESYDNALVIKNPDTYEYTLPDICYSGCIRDDEGNSISFDRNSVSSLWGISNEYVSYYTSYNDRVITSENSDLDKSNKGFIFNVEYKIFIPELQSIINSYDKKYNCILQVTSKKIGSKIDFNFGINNIDGVLNAKTYDIDQSIMLDNSEFIADKLLVGTHGLDMIIKFNPFEDNELNNYTLSDISVWADAKITSAQNEDLFIQLYGSNFSYEYGIADYYEIGLSRQYDGQRQDYQCCFKIKNQYYLILSYYNSDGYEELNKEIYEIINGDFTIEFENLHYYTTDLIKNYHKISDVVLTPKKVNDSKYTINQTITFGDIQLTLNEMEITSMDNHDFNWSGSLKYTGENNLAHWSGCIELVNSNNKKVMDVYIYYNNINGNVDFEGSDVLDDVQFSLLRKASDLHIASITEHYSTKYENDIEYSDSVVNQNRWVNLEYVDIDIDVLNKQRFIYCKAN